MGSLLVASTDGTAEEVVSDRDDARRGGPRARRRLRDREDEEDARRGVGQDRRGGEGSRHLP
jgi:hypothetical protein